MNTVRVIVKRKTRLSKPSSIDTYKAEKCPLQMVLVSLKVQVEEGGRTFFWAEDKRKLFKHCEPICKQMDEQLTVILVIVQWERSRCCTLYRILPETYCSLCREINKEKHEQGTIGRIHCPHSVNV
jgi:hypothetical protein